MRRSGTVMAAVMAGVVMAGPAQTAAQDAPDEEAAVREVVDLYLRSHATGQAEHVARAFHDDLMLYFVRDGALTGRSAADYVAGFSGQPAGDEAQRRRWIAMVDVSGTAAVAKVVLDYPSATITDYFTLLKVDGEWTIMNKVFHSAPK